MPGVLVLEGSQPTLRALTRLLGIFGLDVTGRTSCVQAYAAVAARPFDIGVLELTLCDGNSLGVARALLRRGEAGRVVFYTGCFDSRLLGQAARLGPVVSKDSGVALLLGYVGVSGYPIKW